MPHAVPCRARALHLWFATQAGAALARHRPELSGHPLRVRDRRQHGCAFLHDHRVLRDVVVDVDKERDMGQEVEEGQLALPARLELVDYVFLVYLDKWTKS